MGAKTCILAYSDGNIREILKSQPQLDRAATLVLAQKLFPSARLSALPDATLEESFAKKDEILIGCFSGLSIIVAREFGLDKPSALPSPFIECATGRSIHLHAMHSVVDWFGGAVWQDGKLQRSISLSHDDGIIEDIGERFEFEIPWWTGAHSEYLPEDEVDAEGMPFNFHPLEFAEAALLEFLGFQIEGPVDASQIEAGKVPLMRFKRSKAWWKIW